MKFENTSELPLTHLEKWERSIPADFFIDEELTGDSRDWVKLASRNGYSRQKALNTLVKPAPNSFLLAIAIRRMNDWVPEVRSTANDVVPKIISLTKPKFAVEALTATFKTWNSWNRMAKSDREILIRCTSERVLLKEFIRNIINSGSGPNSHTLPQLGQHEGLDHLLWGIATDVIQPSVRVKAYSSMLGSRFIWADGFEKKWIDKVYGISRIVPTFKSRLLTTTYPFLDTLNAASQDRSVSVRKTSASYLIRNIEKYGNQLLPIAEQFSADPAYSVSYRGKLAINKINELNK